MLGQNGRDLVDSMRADHGSDVAIFRNRNTAQELRIDSRMIQNQEKEGLRRRYFSFPQDADISAGDIVQINGARDFWHITDVEDHVVGGVFVQVKAFYEKYRPSMLKQPAGENNMDPTRLLEFATYASELATLAASVNHNSNKISEYFEKAKVLCDQFDRGQPNGTFVRNKFPVGQLASFESSWQAILNSRNIYPWKNEAEVVAGLGMVANVLRSIASELTEKSADRNAGLNIENNKSNKEKDRHEKPRLFIGSSVEGLEIAEKIQEGLDHSVECTIWSQGVFGLSYGTLESLVEATKKFDCAVLVLTPDDVKIKRNDAKNSPRDNVLFELGLFIGALGRKRTYIVSCRDEQLDLPTDLAGITPAKFGRRSDGNLRAALGTVCSQLKDAIKAAMAEEQS